MVPNQVVNEETIYVKFEKKNTKYNFVKVSKFDYLGTTLSYE